MGGKKVRTHRNHIAREASLSWDKKQLTMRIPREIEKAMKLQHSEKVVVFIDTNEPVADKRHHTIMIKVVDAYD